MHHGACTLHAIQNVVVLFLHLVPCHEQESVLTLRIVLWIFAECLQLSENEMIANVTATRNETIANVTATSTRSGRLQEENMAW